MNDTHLKSFSQFNGGFSCSQRVFATLGVNGKLNHTHLRQ
ncbi:hypothetical protein Desor_2255 [Desulfosporosinus orientis DSM 765]|uniref:Uncharacterized protein n=1 Tax=Desulfosporosinus orientis (strain ATCC 19365 / DSM 765 / NCIMB 8382 / VKM B-1628 / Singapore I) TaxID=768706 RepID=G7WB74_DESOD|nr:hypothetical protein Desor_2255 [Desulfosporosinus orientis DSM 765]